MLRNPIKHGATLKKRSKSGGRNDYLKVWRTPRVSGETNSRLGAEARIPQQRKEEEEEQGGFWGHPNHGPAAEKPGE